jgi:hypothetical protein
VGELCGFVGQCNNVWIVCSVLVCDGVRSVTESSRVETRSLVGDDGVVSSRTRHDGRVMVKERWLQDDEIVMGEEYLRRIHEGIVKDQGSSLYKDLPWIWTIQNGERLRIYCPATGKTWLLLCLDRDTYCTVSEEYGKPGILPYKPPIPYKIIYR